MKEIYSAILDGVADLTGTSRDTKEFTQYLESLKPLVRQLRRGFQVDCVQVNYAELDVQVAYLITYFPQYAEMTLEAMDKLDPKFYPSISKNLNICLFGAGPLPEIIGLIEFLNSHYPSLNYLNIRAYDIAADTWSISHRIVKDFILPRVWSGAIKLESINFDLCEQNAFFRT